MTSYGDLDEAPPSLGAAMCDTATTFSAPRRASAVRSYADLDEASLSLGGGLRSAKLSPLSELLGGPAQ